MFLFCARMRAYRFPFRGTELAALASGALWWAERRLLAVSDLHLGKSDRIARRGGPLLPPYENRATLDRLADLVGTLDPATVICLGDSFDDLAGQEALAEPEHETLTRLMAGRRWIWIEGNHDPGPITLGGTHLAEYATGPLVFRHIARTGGEVSSEGVGPAPLGEISGHYHPKASIALGGGRLTRPCFLIDSRRVILPAFGAYTGGLRTTDPALAGLMSDEAIAVLTGRRALPVPMPRPQAPTPTGQETPVPPSPQ